MAIWLGAVGPAGAQDAPPAASNTEYQIGIDDVLQISVWLHAELDRTVTVDARGQIAFPPLGSIPAQGMTPKQLADRISERLSTYLRSTTTVTVTVSQFMSRSVFVTGAVALPGRYGFETLPNLIEVLSRAGGGLVDADLSRVAIVRREGSTRRTLTADVARALSGDPTIELPELQPGDIVAVPRLVGSATVSASLGAVVLGAVRTPGIYPVGDGLDLWMVLGLAGGPGDRANLSQVRILPKDIGTQSLISVNLKDVLDKGNRKDQIVKAGDIVYVVPRGVTPWEVFRELLNAATDVVTVVAVVETIQD
jgi:polysaccharide export outer membrane protein